MIVQAGEVIPADGYVISGLATVDQQMHPYEAQPFEKTTDDARKALVLTGRLRLVVKQAGEATVAAQIGDILNNSQDYKDTIKMRSAL